MTKLETLISDLTRVPFAYLKSKGCPDTERMRYAISVHTISSAQIKAVFEGAYPQIADKTERLSLLKYFVEAICFLRDATATSEQFRSNQDKIKDVLVEIKSTLNKLAKTLNSDKITVDSLLGDSFTLLGLPPPYPWQDNKGGQAVQPFLESIQAVDLDDVISDHQAYLDGCDQCLAKLREENTVLNTMLETRQAAIPGDAGTGIQPSMRPNPLLTGLHAAGAHSLFARRLGLPVPNQTERRESEEPDAGIFARTLGDFNFMS